LLNGPEPVTLSCPHFKGIVELARILLIIIFLFQHTVLAAQGFVVHLPDDSHDLLWSVEQPHSHGPNHDHDDDDEHHAEHDAKTTDQLLSSEASNTHDASAHEHPSHILLVADLPAQPYSCFTVKNGTERYVHKSQLTGITHTPPVPPPNA